MAELKKYATIGFIAFGFAFIHYKYVSNIFENQNNFSHLSDLEREMALRTEMGFYYSYYKTIVEEHPFIAGITKLMYDKIVEYPKEVNAFNRFNIHPEFIIGTVYRYLEPLLNDSTKRDCHIVDRGEEYSLVESCTDLGQPMIFYLEAVWWLAGLTVGALFLHAVTLSGSIAGGVISIVHYFANHMECTRVQWAPNERENMAMPLLLLQTWLLTLQLRGRNRRPVLALQISIFILNCLCLLFWQFTQFIFLTQMAIYFFMEQVRIIDVKALSVFLHSHFCGLHLAVLLLQGNDMLKTSLYTSFFLVVSIYCLFFSSLRINVRNRRDLLLEIFLIVTRIVIVVIISLGVKKVLSDFLDVQEDSHIWEILYSKFTSYETFHTLIYTCSDVFDFLPWRSIRAMLISFLIPISLLNTYYFFNSLFVRGVRRWAQRNIHNTNSDETEPFQSETNANATEPDHQTEQSNSEVIRPEETEPQPNEIEQLNPHSTIPDRKKCKKSETDMKIYEKTNPEINESGESSLELKDSDEITPESKGPGLNVAEETNARTTGFVDRRPDHKGPAEIKPKPTGSEETKREPKESEIMKTELTEFAEARPIIKVSKPEPIGSKNTKLEQETMSEELRPDLDKLDLKVSEETRSLTGPESRSNSSEADDSGIESNAESRTKTKRTLNSSDVPAKTVKKEIPEDSFVKLLKCFIIDPAIFYNIAQMIIFAMMAGLVMRLKLLFTTQMCLIASLMARKNHYYVPNVYKKYLPIAYVMLIAPTLRSLIRNVQQECSYIGEFSDYPQEQLLQWITREAGTGAFAGSMPILASVMLSTRKPIVIHPHYEHLETRERAYSIYKMYGRFKSEELYRELNKLEASYLIVEHKYCYGRSNNDCSFGDIWDIQEPSIAHRPLLCHTLLNEHVDHFYPLFRNSEYAVFRVHDVSVRYMPRSFDT